MSSARIALARTQPGFCVEPEGMRLPPVVFGITGLGNLYRAHAPASKAAYVAACRAATSGTAVFDGAGKYGAGLALEELGRALRAQATPAESVVISNKLAWRQTPLRGAEPTFEPGAWVGIGHDAVQDISYDGILRCWNEGHELLGEPYRTALVSVHDPDEYLAVAGDDAAERARRFDDILGAYRALEELRARGQALGVGVGVKDWHVAREIATRVRLDWAMIACSLTVLRHPPELLAWVEEMARGGARVIDSALFHGGFLTGGDFFDYRRVDTANEEGRRLLAWRESFTAICARHDVAPAHASVRFAARVPGIASVALSTSDPARVRGLIAMAIDDPPAALWRDLIDGGLIGRKLEFLA